MRRFERGTLSLEGFAAAAATVAPDASGKSESYHGYYFRILKAQGAAAPGGALDYVVKGKMMGGSALVAWQPSTASPASRRSSSATTAWCTTRILDRRPGRSPDR